MNKQKRTINKIMPIIVITIIIISFSSPAFAYQNNSNSTKNKVVTEESIKNKNNKKNKRNTKMEIHESIKKAIENKNYNDWKTLLEENKNPQNERLLAVINQDNFERYANAKISAENGDHTDLNQLKTELGLNYKIK